MGSPERKHATPPGATAPRRGGRMPARATLLIVLAALIAYLTVLLSLFAFSGGEYDDVPVGDRIMQAVPVAAVGILLVLVAGGFALRIIRKQRRSTGDGNERR